MTTMAGLAIVDNGATVVGDLTLTGNLQVRRVDCCMQSGFSMRVHDVLARVGRDWSAPIPCVVQMTSTTIAAVTSSTSQKFALVAQASASAFVGTVYAGQVLTGGAASSLLRLTGAGGASLFKVRHSSNSNSGLCACTHAKVCSM